MKFKELIEPLKDVKSMAILTAFAGVAAAGLNLTRPLLLGDIIEGFTKRASANYAIFLIALFSLSWCATWGLSILLRYLSTKVKESILTQLRTGVLRHLLKIPYAQSEKYPSGKIQAYMMSDLPLWSNLFGTLLAQVMHSAAQWVGAAITLIHVNFELVLLLFPFLLLSATQPLISAKYMIRIHRTAQDAVSDTLEMSQGIIQGCRDIVSLDIEKWMLQWCTKACAVSERAETKRSLALGIVQTLGALTQNAAYILVLGVGGWEVLKGSMSVGDLVSFLATIELIFFPARNASDLASEIHNSLAASNRVQEFLSVQPNHEKPIMHSCIEFKNVSYTYSNTEQKALDSISFEINQGNLIVILGESGSGKSTLLKIIAGLYQPTEGEIVKKGADLGTPSAVWQDPFLFNATVYDNLALGRDISESQMKAMAQKLNLDHLFAEMPNQYDTELLENGRNLSGGQRQRIAIIRSLFSGKKCIIFDEPTAGLDIENARKVWDAIIHLNEDVTRIVTTHQLDEIHRHADLILVLQKGKLIEVGQPQELLKRNGYYKKMIEKKV